MKIGLTYDLREDYLRLGYDLESTAEFDHPATIEAIEAALVRLGHVTDRIGSVQELAHRLVEGDRWDLVFNIAEGANGVSREAQVPALLDAYRVPYTFSEPLACALTLHKAMAKRVVRDHEIPTPAFEVVEVPSDVDRIELPYPVFAKPVAEGSGKGIDAGSVVPDPTALDRVCRSLLSRYRQPVLVEAFLPGREFTVGILGTGDRASVIGVVEVEFRPEADGAIYSYSNKAHYEGRVRYRLVVDKAARKAGSVALAAWRALGCRDAGRIDLKADGCGQPQFLEANPLAGLDPVRSDLPIMCGLVGMSYNDLVARILDSALVHSATDDAPRPDVITRDKHRRHGGRWLH
jgi:D-alanine-D-alanine ligase